MLVLMVLMWVFCSSGTSLKTSLSRCGIFLVTAICAFSSLVSFCFSEKEEEDDDDKNTNQRKDPFNISNDEYYNPKIATDNVLRTNVAGKGAGLHEFTKHVDYYFRV